MMDDLLRLSGEVSIQAAADGAPSASKPPRISIVGYTGGVVSIGGWGPVVFDFQGLQRPPVVSILDNHGSDDLDSIVGSGVPTVRNNRLTVEGTLLPDSPKAKR
ncbi:MAG: hypothetical protein NTW96_25345 [Planctomycetia bacterium]|nr:hypothetical protein [Planctomycetia bacterium]